MFKKVLILALIICLSRCINLLYYSQIPVSRLAMLKALLSMDYLKNNLDTTFHAPMDNKSLYYVRTKLTQQYLNDISNELKQYNNVVIGQNNSLTGLQNLLVGDNNQIKGSENWIFSEGFNGIANKDLILDHWQVEMDKSELINTDPRLAIRKW